MQVCFAERRPVHGGAGNIGGVVALHAEVGDGVRTKQGLVRPTGPHVRGGGGGGDGGLDLDGAGAVPTQVPLSQAIAALKPLLEDPGVLKVGQNIKYDRLVLGRYGIEIGPFDDAMLLSYVLDGGRHGQGGPATGAHTALVAKARPLGIETVRQAVQDDRARPWLERLLFEEIVPTPEGRTEATRRFAETTLERFSNPFLEHRLADIALEHDVKLATRLAPTLREFRERFGRTPPLLDEILN